MEGRRLRQPWLLIAAILMLIIHYSCSDRSDRNSEVLIVGEISDYEALNPIGTSDAHAKDIHPHLFLNLFEEQGDFITFEPRLAKSYSFSEDRSELIVIIRDDVYWSDGTRTTVENVVETLNIQKHPDVLWSGRHLKEHVDSAVAINDSTVVFYFNHTYPYQLMDVNDGPILPTHFFAGYDMADIRSIPIEEIPTNGPYKVREWVRGQYLRLIAYEGFYDSPKPYINEVIFKMIPDQSVLITQLLSGEIDCMESIPPMKYHEIKAGNPEITLYNYPSRAYGYLGWRCDHPVFSDAEIRIAMTMAIDREKIVENLYTA